MKGQRGDVRRGEGAKGRREKKDGEEEGDGGYRGRGRGIEGEVND